MINNRIDEEIVANMKLVDALKEFAAKIGKALKNYDASSAEARILGANYEQTTEFLKTYAEVMKETGEKNRAEGKTGSFTDARGTESEKTKDRVNKLGAAAYSEQEKKNLSNSGKIKIAETAEDIIDYINNEINKSNHTRLYCGKVTETASARIKEETGIDVDNFNIEINNSFENSHSDPKKERLPQIVMTPEHIAEFPTVVNNFDEVVRTGNTKDGRPVLRFMKEDGEYKYAVVYVTNGHKSLVLQTSYWRTEKKNSHRAADVPNDTNPTTSKTDTDMNSYDSKISDSSEKSSETVMKSLKTAAKETELGTGKSMEQTDKLLAVHNLTEEQLLWCIQNGGFPAPSIAIIRQGMNHDNYGPISVLFYKDTIDPAKSKNYVYGADAYTPTVQGVAYEVKQKEFNSFSEELRELGDKADRYFTYGGMYEILGSIGSDVATTLSAEEIFAKYRNNHGLQAAYLEKIGKHFEPVKVYKDKGYEVGKESLYKKLVKHYGEQALQEYQWTRGHLDEKKEWEEKYGADFANELARQDLGDSYVEGQTSPFKLKARQTILLMDAWKYLNEKDKPDELVVNMSDTGYALAEELDRDNIREDYEKWLKEHIDGFVGDRGIWNGKPYITDAGNRRTYKQLYNAYTAENIVKAMYGEQSARAQGANARSAEGLQSAAGKSYQSIEDIREDSGRLRNMDEQEYAKRVVSNAEIAKVVLPDRVSNDLVYELAKNRIRLETYEYGNEEDRKAHLNDQQIMFSKKIYDGRIVDNLFDVMTMSQHRQFMSEISTKDKGKFLKDNRGDAIVPIENLLVYTDFRYNDPGVSRIVAFESEEDTGNTLNDIYHLCREEKLDYETAIRIIRSISREKDIWEYTNENFGHDGKYDRQTARGSRRSAAYHAEKKQERRGIYFDDEGNELKSKKSTSTTFDSIFSDADQSTIKRLAGSVIRGTGSKADANTLEQLIATAYTMMRDDSEETVKKYLHDNVRRGSRHLKAHIKFAFRRC